MKVNSQRDISFNGICKNKVLKKGLEFAASDSGRFAATTTLAFSMFVRPVSIWLTPKTDKENKKVACAKSIASSSMDYLLTLGLITPVANSIGKINRHPEQYLKQESIKNLQNGCSKLSESKAYSLATQMFKIGLRLFIAIPKAILTTAGLPIVMHYFFHKPYIKPNQEESNETQKLSFKGKEKGSEKIAQKIASLLDKQGLQEFSKKHKDSNFIMHIVSATDALTTATFIHETNRSKKIEEKRKKAVIYNAGISTTLSIICSYILDNLSKKPTEKFIEYYRKVNQGDAHLEKQIEGIRVAKPIILVGTVYYMLIPFISTFLAELAEHNPKLDIPHKNNFKHH